MPRTAYIDTDFFQALADIERHNDVPSLLNRFFIALDVVPYMHPFVYKHEIEHFINPKKRKIFEMGVIKIPQISEVLDNPLKEFLYKNTVEELYRILNRDEIPLNDVMSEWKYMANLGEIHSMALGAIQSDMHNEIWFLSDDCNASRRIKFFASTLVQKLPRVLTRLDCVNHLRTNGQEILTNECKLSGRELKMLSYEKKHSEDI